MIGSTINPRACPGNRIAAMVIPPAMPFFEPQNTIEISSSVEKPIHRLPAVVMAITMARIARSIARTAPRLTEDAWLQIPSTIPALNAA